MVPTLSTYHFDAWRRDGPWILSSVCRKWRDVAMESPAIWTYLAIGDRSHLRAEALGQYVHDVLTRSQEEPLYVVLRDLWYMHEHASLATALLHTSSHRWVSLEISTSRAIDIDYTDSVPMLRHLVIVGPDSDPKTAVAMGAWPDLRVLRLKHVSMDSPVQRSPKTSENMSLHLSDCVSTAPWWTILEAIGPIEALYWDTRHDTGMYRKPTIRIDFIHMRTMMLSGSAAGDCIVKALGTVTFSSVVELTITGAHGVGRASLISSDIFPQLETLVLVDGVLDDHHVAALVLMPTLREITILSCTLTDGFYDIFDSKEGLDRLTTLSISANYFPRRAIHEDLATMNRWALEHGLRHALPR